MDFCGQESHLRESTISELESPSNFQVKEKKNAKIVMFKMAYGSPGIDYRVALLFTRYVTAIGIIPESLKLIGQF